MKGESGGHSRFFGQKLKNTAWCGQVRLLITRGEMGKCIERVFRKNSLKLNAASHTTTSWHPDTDGFLEHSPSGGSLY